MNNFAKDGMKVGNGMDNETNNEMGYEAGNEMSDDMKHEENNDINNKTDNKAANDTNNEMNNNPDNKINTDTANDIDNDTDSEGDSEIDLEALFDPRVMRAIQEMGFEKMTPIQEQAIPYLLDGHDIIGQAQTGTGKTAAFGIPIIQKIDPDLQKLQAIILCPTRELAVQAAGEIRRLAKYMHGIKVLPIYGGQEIRKQITALKGVNIIVGTPGRVMDHMRRNTIKLDHVNMVVLDEADEMLNMGFREDMELILGEIPNEHQTALFSATMPKPILEITGKFQKDAKFIKVAAKELTIPLVTQRYYRIKSRDKDAACIRLLEYYQPKLCLIFCNTKRKVDEVAECLKKAGYQAEALHGDMSQNQRDVAMGRFRNGSTNILIATDVAARGIDVDNVEAVINYDIPYDTEYYVHRIGRTGRAGKTGRSFTFVSGKEIYRVRDIERFCRTTIEENKMPGAAKVMKAKAKKFLDQAWELKESEDFEVMKKYINRKMEAEECDAMDVAAVLLKYYVGEKGGEIESDDFITGRVGKGRERGRDRDRGRDREGRSRILGSGGRGKGRSFEGIRGRDGGRRDDRDRDRGSYEGGRDRGRGFDGSRDRDRSGYEGGRDRGGRDRDKGYEGRRDRERDGFDGGRDRDRGYEGRRDRERDGFDGGRDRDRGYEGRRDRERNGFEGSRDRDRGYEGRRDRDKDGFEGGRDRDRGYDGSRDRDRSGFESRRGRDDSRRREEGSSGRDRRKDKAFPFGRKTEF